MLEEKVMEKKFEKKLKLRTAMSAVIVICGIVSVVFSIYAESQSFFAPGSDLVGFYTGMGGGLLGAGLVTMFRSLRLLKDDGKRKKVMLEEYDERNIYLRNATMTLSGYIMVGVLYLGTVIAGFYNERVAMVLLTLLGIYLLLIFCINIVLRKIR